MVIDAYVTSLGAALRGPRAAKRDLLTEVRDSLHDAAAHHESAGATGEDAARLAVEAFGPVRELAGDYQRELALSQGRRTALLVAAAVAAQSVIAEVSWRSAAVDWTWQPDRGYAFLARAVDYTGYAVVLLGLLAALACGVGSRYVDVGRGFVRATGLAAIGVCAFFILGGAALSILSPAWHTTTTTATPLTLAASAITTALPIWMIYSGLHCLRASSPASPEPPLRPLRVRIRCPAHARRGGRPPLPPAAGAGAGAQLALALAPLPPAVRKTRPDATGHRSGPPSTIPLRPRLPSGDPSRALAVHPLGPLDPSRALAVRTAIRGL